MAFYVVCDIAAFSEIQLDPTVLRWSQWRWWPFEQLVIIRINAEGNAGEATMGSVQKIVERHKKNAMIFLDDDRAPLDLDFLPPEIRAQLPAEGATVKDLRQTLPPEDSIGASPS
jgi:hypothetical protein